MKLLTKAIEKQLVASPLYTHDDKNPANVPVIFKVFNPYGMGTWFITEGEKEGDDYRLFGLCVLHEAELGYVMLSELTSVQPIRGLGLERDLHHSGSLADAMKEYNYNY